MSSKKILIIVLCFLVSLSSFCTAFTQERVLVSSYAMGYAVTAIENGLEGAFKNPATMIVKNQKECLLTMSDTYGMDIQHGLVGLGYQLPSRVFLSLTVPMTHVGDIKETQLVNGTPTQIDTFSSLELSPRLTLSRQVMNRVTIGASCVGLYHQAYDESAMGGSFDIGLLAQFNRMNVGISIQDIGWTKTWTTGQTDHQSMTLNLGTMIHPINAVAILADMSIMENKMQVNVGSKIRVISAINANLGLVDIGQSNHLRAGIDCTIGNFSVRYAYGLHHQLGDSHKVGISIGY